MQGPPRKDLPSVIYTHTYIYICKYIYIYTHANIRRTHRIMVMCAAGPSAYIPGSPVQLEGPLIAEVRDLVGSESCREGGASLALHRQSLAKVEVRAPHDCP